MRLIAMSSNASHHASFVGAREGRREQDRRVEEQREIIRERATDRRTTPNVRHTHPTTKRKKRISQASEKRR